MRRITSVFLVAAATFVLATAPKAQQTSSNSIPQTISYQGVLQQNGQTAPDGSYSIQFTLYNDAAGKTSVWQGNYSVQVAGGVFNVLLGSGDSPLPTATALDGPMYLGVKIGDAAEMSLTPLSSAPYAFNVADGSITAKKMATDYIGSISVNGQKVSGQGTNLNIQGSNGLSVLFDPTTQSIILSSSGGTPNPNKGGETPFGPPPPINGTGTAGDIPVFTAAQTIGNSSITDNGTSVGIGSHFSVTESNGNTTIGGTLTATVPTSDLSGSVAIANGGTGATTASGAMTNLLPSQTGNNGKVLSTNGSGTLSWITSGGSTGFDGIVSGTNSSATMTVGTGASIVPSGSGVITATGLASGSSITESQVTNLTSDLAGKQNTIAANTYDAYGAATTAQNNAIGHFTAGTGIGVTAGGVISNSGVTSFNSRTGAVLPVSTDYSSFYDATGAATAAQSNAIGHFSAGTGIGLTAGGVISNSGVTTFNGRTGAVTPSSADYASYYDASGAATAAQNNAVGHFSAGTGIGLTAGGVISNSGVTTFNGRSGAVAPSSSDYSSYYDASGAATTAQTNAIAHFTAGTGIAISGAGVISSTATSGVTSFNTRTGAVTLTAADVDALGAITNNTSGTASTITGSITHSQISDWATQLNAYETHANVQSDARAAISATAPITYNSTSGVISMVQANGTVNGFLSDEDWTKFNNSQANAIAHFSAGSGISLGADGKISTTGAPPTGGAGGDLAGSYPNPTIANTANAGNDIVNAMNHATADINNSGLNITAEAASFTTLQISNAFTPGGSAGTSGQVLVSNGAGVAPSWSTVAPGLVTSVFGRTGAITAQSGDYSSFYDASGAASTAQTNAINHFSAGTGIAISGAGVISATGSGVTSFNTRTGDITLTTADVNAVGTITNNTSGTANSITGTITHSQVSDWGTTTDPVVNATNATNATTATNLSGNITTSQVTGLGTMATQDASSVSVSGGSISGTAITGVYYSASTASVTVPASAMMVEIGDPGGSHIVNITLPAVNNGQVIHIHNAASLPTTGDIVIPTDGLFTVMATGGHWVLQRN